MAMTKKTRQQVSVLIVVAVVLILLILIGIILVPLTGGSGSKNPSATASTSQPQENTSSSDNIVDFEDVNSSQTDSSSDVSSGSDTDNSSDTNSSSDINSGSDTDDEPPPVISSYTVTVKFIDSQFKGLADTKFVISLNDIGIITDSNGYIIFRNLPQGLYNIYATDKNGNKNDKLYCEFQLSSDGAVSVGYAFFEKDETVYIMYDGESLVGINEKDIPKKEPVTESEPEEEYEEEDPTYTNFSWMKDVEMEYGAYGISLYRDPELFYEVLNNPEYSYFNTFLLPGNNLELTLKTAEELKAKGKKMWLEVNDLLTFKSFGGLVVSGNLRADWQKILNEWATEIHEVAGDYFQGFYFDEASYYYNSRDFTRITKYMRETFKLRTFVVHCSAAYMTPYNRNRDIIGYSPAPNDPMVISAENHKYVTDVGWWRYGSIREYGDIDVSFNEWSKAMSLLDENTRKWYVPAIGAYYWNTLETDTLDIQYTMFKNNAQLEGFGGIMHYTMSWSSLSGRPTPVNPEDERLTEDDYYYDENGEKVVSLDHNYSSVDRDDAYMEGNGAYFVMEHQENGTYRWPKVRKYMDILGKGLINGESYETILGKLEAVYKPDFSKYE